MMPVSPRGALYWSLFEELLPFLPKQLRKKAQRLRSYVAHLDDTTTLPESYPKLLRYEHTLQSLESLCELTHSEFPEPPECYSPFTQDELDVVHLIGQIRILFPALSAPKASLGDSIVACVLQRQRARTWALFQEQEIALYALMIKTYNEVSGAFFGDALMRIVHQDETTRWALYGKPARTHPQRQETAHQLTFAAQIWRFLQRMGHKLLALLRVPWGPNKPKNDPEPPLPTSTASATVFANPYTFRPPQHPALRHQALQPRIPMHPSAPS